ELDVARHHLHGLAVTLGNKVVDLEIPHLAGDAAGEARRVERRDRPDAALAGRRGLPGWLDADARATQRAQPRHHHPSCPPFVRFGRAISLGPWARRVETRDGSPEGPLPCDITGCSIP